MCRACRACRACRLCLYYIFIFMLCMYFVLSFAVVFAHEVSKALADSRICKTLQGGGCACVLCLLVFCSVCCSIVPRLVCLSCFVCLLFVCPFVCLFVCLFVFVVCVFAFMCLITLPW